MLVLSRKLNESILIGENIRVTVLGIRGNQVRLGFEAPDWVQVMREELCDADPAPPAPYAAGSRSPGTAAPTAR